MAIVKCPECGRENVSNTAEACPSCGYNIKAHFENMGQQSETQTTVAESPSVPEEKAVPPILESKTNKKKIKKVSLKSVLSIVVALIVGFGVGAWALSPNSAPTIPKSINASSTLTEEGHNILVQSANLELNQAESDVMKAELEKAILAYEGAGGNDLLKAQEKVNEKNQLYKEVMRKVYEVEWQTPFVPEDD